MANEGLFGAFGSYDWIFTLGRWIVIFFIFLFVALILTSIVLFIVIKLKSKKVIEISQQNKKINTFSYRKRKNPHGLLMAWLGGGNRKFIPQFQEKDVFSRGKKEYIFLLKDNNGLHHTLRIPNYAELKKWYSVVYGVDIQNILNKDNDLLNDKERRLKKGLGTIFMTPNPSEDLDWLANQIIESKKEFATAWWQSPVIMVIGTVTLCVFMFIVSLIITKKM